MNRVRTAVAAAAVTAALWSTPTTAYDIIWPRLHEAFTLAAVECQQAAARLNTTPTDCRAYRGRVAQLSNIQWALTNLQREVRWPDDPRREIRGASFFRPAINGKFAACEGKLKRGRELQRVGLFCASHFGDFQFFHAMSAAIPDSSGQLQPEDTEVTRGKILDWAAFTYEVATRQVKAGENYCQQFDGRHGKIAAAMVPTGFPYCSTRPEGWTVGEFFSFRCRQLILWQSCGLVPGDESFVPTVAQGALIHLIQDSYSQSHALRTDAPVTDEQGVAQPRVECGKPRRYLAYTREAQKTHGAADKLPAWMASCDGEADDIITASAMALHYIDRGAPTEEFIRYLETKVF